MFMYDLLEYKAIVEKCYEHNGKMYVILNNTIFYPEGGGQLCDVGTINDAVVLDVFKYEGQIIHEVDSAVEGEVLCKVDEVVRKNNSMLHTSQHLFSAVFERSGYETTSFSMKEGYFTIDIVDRLSREELDVFENKINEYIREGRNVEARYYDDVIDVDVDVEGINFNKIRLVIIDGLDKNICGGTHIKNISEINYLKIVKYKYSGTSTRVDVMVSDQAIDYVNKCFNTYYEIVKLINQNDVETYNYIEAKLKENKKLSKKLSKLEKSMMNDKK